MTRLSCVAAACLAVTIPGPVWGQTAPAATDDSLAQRPSLFAGPDGFKSALAQRGILLDGSLTQFYQGVVSGDGSKIWQYGGKGDLIATFDGAKLGLWRGFSVSFHQEWLYGQDANTQGDGSILALDTAMTFPRLGGYDHDTSINMTQAFGDNFSLSVGKFNLLDAVARSPIIGGGGIDTFMHLGLAAPITGVTPPYLLGSIATLKTSDVVVTAMVYDPRNAQDPEVLRRPFSDGTTTSVSLTFPARVAGLGGFYGVRGVYSTQEGVDFNSLPGLILPAPDQSAGRVTLTKAGYWYTAANVQQFLWQDSRNPQVGWGLFGEVGVSDGNPNPVKWHVFGGLGGNNPLFERQADRWGIGYFSYSFSPELTHALSLLNFDLAREQGLEAYYNYALTNWVRLTGDLQYIDPGRADRKDAVISTMRLQTRF